MNATTWNPADCQAHDAAEATAGEAFAKAEASLSYAEDAVQDAAGNALVYTREPNSFRSVGRRPHAWTTAEALALLPEYAERTAARYHAAKAERDRTRDEYVALAECYTGWSRFYLVADGHVHSSTRCSSCNKGANLTEFRWVTSLSGLTEADAVAEYGSLLCTWCFTTAPVEFTDGSTVGRVVQAARDAKAAERNARNEAKRVKALRDDLARVEVRYTPGRFGTEQVATLSALKGRMTDAAEYGHAELVLAMAELFTARTNELPAQGHGKATTVEAEVAAAARRAAKR